MATDQDIVQPPAPRDDAAAPPVRILLVDDRPENLVALEAILGSLDHELVRAASGEEALKALLTTEFALILLDASMPGMDGFETAARIKRRERTRDIPILFLTAHQDEPQHAFRGYEVGAVDYLTKPFDPWILRAKVSVFVDLYLKNRQLKEQAALLRRQLTAAAEAAGRSGPDVVAELSGRLAAVEEQLTVLVAATSAEPDSAAGTTLAELVRRIGHLREAVDALDTQAASLPQPEPG
jgi:CheY-like chemotaxis protein